MLQYCSSYKYIFYSILFIRYLSLSLTHTHTDGSLSQHLLHPSSFLITLRQFTKAIVSSPRLQSHHLFFFLFLFIPLSLLLIKKSETLSRLCFCSLSESHSHESTAKIHLPKQASVIIIIGQVRNRVLASFFWVEAIVCNSDKIRLGIGDQWRLQEFFFKGVIKKL